MRSLHAAAALMAAGGSFAAATSSSKQMPVVFHSKKASLLQVNRHKRHHHADMVSLISTATSGPDVNDDQTFEVANASNFESNDQQVSANVAPLVSEEANQQQMLEQNSQTDAGEEEQLTRTEIQVADAQQKLAVAEAAEQERANQPRHVEVAQPVALSMSGARALSQRAAPAVGPPAVTAPAQPPAGTRPKGWDQCLKFARKIKANGVTGTELVRVWKTTCEPAVQSGAATERYKLMCNSLGGAVQPFAAVVDYDVFKMCDAVLTVFHDVLAQ